MSTGKNIFIGKSAVLYIYTDIYIHVYTVTELYIISSLAHDLSLFVIFSNINTSAEQILPS
jgi:hypothetical protein